MNRATLEKAIQFGMRKAAGKDAAAAASSIADAIEMAIEMGSEEQPAAKPAPVVDWPIPITAPLPPSPAAAPEPPSAGRTIPPPAEVRHIDAAAPPKPITLEQLIQALNHDTPTVISIGFPGKEPYLLERNVISDPVSKSARLIYKHPPAPDGMEASVAFFAEIGMPDLDWGMAAVRAFAEKVYAPRGKSQPVPVHEYEGPVTASAGVDQHGHLVIPEM